MKRVISVLLSALVFGSICAYAEDGAVINDLYEFKIIADKSDIRPDDNVTRAEAVKMICAATAKEILGGERAEEQMFTDVPVTHWASKYIEVGYGNGIISGYGDGTFIPEGNVTYLELQKMLVSALGFDMYVQTAGGYPDGYLMYSKQLGINKGLTFENNAPATRGGAMQMIYNMLDAPIMDTRGWVIDENGEKHITVKLYDGGSYPFMSYRMVLSGEAEY